MQNSDNVTDNNNNSNVTDNSDTVTEGENHSTVVVPDDEVDSCNREEAVEVIKGKKKSWFVCCA